MKIQSLSKYNVCAGRRKKEKEYLFKNKIGMHNKERILIFRYFFLTS